MLSGLSVFLGTVGLVVQSQGQGCVMPTPDFAIVNPPASVSQQAASFSGEWDGTWTYKSAKSGNGANSQSPSFCGVLLVLVTSNHSAGSDLLFRIGSRRRTTALPQLHGQDQGR